MIFDAVRIFVMTTTDIQQSVCFLLIAIEIIVIAVFLFRFKMDSEISDLSQQIFQNSQAIKSNQDLETKIRVASSQINFLEKTEKDKFLPQDVLNDLEQATPQTALFSDLTLSANKINFTGQVPDNTSFATLITNLQNFEWFDWKNFIASKFLACT